MGARTDVQTTRLVASGALNDQSNQKSAHTCMRTYDDVSINGWVHPSTTDPVPARSSHYVSVKTTSDNHCTRRHKQKQQQQQQQQVTHAEGTATRTRMRLSIAFAGVNVLTVFLLA